MTENLPKSSNESGEQDPLERIAKLEAELSLKDDVIEELRREIRDLRDIAYRDSLTGLESRRYFDEDIKKAFEEERDLEKRRKHEAMRETKSGSEEHRISGKGLTMVMFDIDHFKSINDTYGHEAGDEVLKQAALYLTKQVGLRSDDRLAFYREDGKDFNPEKTGINRIGGEEFAMILRDCGSDDAVEGKFIKFYNEQSGNIELGFTAEFDYKDENSGQIKRVSLDITFSAGVCELRDDHKSPKDLIRNADEALYIAKQTGRHKLVSYDRIEEEKRDYEKNKKK